MRIRAARGDELEVFQAVERAAGEAFRGIGMPEIADDEPLAVGVLAEYVRGGRAWAADDGGGAVGYLIVDLVDDGVHIEQVSVHPRCARRGVGRLLIEEAAGYAARIGASRVTLTTFAEVPWNAPYYRRCGFTVLPDEAIGVGLRAVREHERAVGLDRWVRVCMERHVSGQNHKD
ncbi:GNAT family N-acetyltransferase [Actinoplanes sp. G11-F43]|uniref:GNAT family N-acetyltransferase n=1 Tax=Actinoplanes sp. G11-F43 TaxID=3424130 RepID=UPI003D34A70C